MLNILVCFLVLNIFCSAQIDVLNSDNNQSKRVLMKVRSSKEQNKENNEKLPENKSEEQQNSENKTLLPSKSDKHADIPIDEHNKTALILGNSTPATNKTESDKRDEHILIYNRNKLDHPGALLRGFYVFVGLSIIVLAYFLIRAFRLRSGAAPSTTVRKYGIVGRRSDMEMLPLPLADDDEDDTLFEVGSQVHR